MNQKNLKLMRSNIHIHMKKFMALLLLNCSAFIVFAQTPDWISYSSRQLKYSNAQYYTGYAENSYTKKENPHNFLDKQKEKAASNLSENVQIRVESLTTNLSQQENSEVSSYFKNSIATYSNVELIGLQYLTYIDKKEKKVYVLAYLEKQALNKYYQQKLQSEVTRLDNLIQKAESFFQASNTKQAKIEHSNALLQANKCNSVQALLYASNTGSSTTSHTEKLIQLNQRLNQLLIKIETGEKRSINDLAALLSEKIIKGIPNHAQLKISYPTYADTKFTSPFAKRFSQVLQQELSNKGISILENPDHNTLLLKGTYWEESENIRVSLAVSDVNGKLICADENIMNKQYLIDKQISYKAENFSDAYTRMQHFRKDEMLSGDMLLELWTNKGDENLLFQEGERLKLFVRVNTPSYLRVIYYLADGSKVLLLDNYYIDQSKINKVVEIPDEFECAEPFGYETLQLSAQTKTFKSLQTQVQYGYQFITESTNAIMANTRGFKKVSSADKKAEVRLNMTTYR